MVMERIQGTPQRVTIQVRGCAPLGDEPVGWFVLNNQRHEIPWLLHKTQAVEDHSLDGVAHGDQAILWVLLRGVVNDRANATFIEHPGYQAEMIQALSAIWLWHSRLLRRGDSPDTPKSRK